MRHGKKIKPSWGTPWNEWIIYFPKGRCPLHRRHGKEVRQDRGQCYAALRKMAGTNQVRMGCIPKVINCRRLALPTCGNIVVDLRVLETPRCPCELPRRPCVGSPRLCRGGAQRLLALTLVDEVRGTQAPSSTGCKWRQTPPESCLPVFPPVAGNIFFSRPVNSIEAHHRPVPD